MLPVNTAATSPSWGFDGNLEAPTLTPSILSSHDHRYVGPDLPREKFVCHSFMEAGHLRFLGDCTHALANQTVPLPPIPDWAL